ncbi:MAG: VWA domain-containing protein [Planctomycetales bacterium]|nr:VWA domain-containing protein [Planctomycetales bacterium]
MATATWAAAIVALITAVAEFRHQRRIDAMAPLAFGPDGARSWTRGAPAARVLAGAALAWGLTFLAVAEPQTVGALGEHTAPMETEADEHLQRVLLVLDISPSMNVEDSGTEQKLRRRDRVYEVVESLLSRIALGRTKFSVVVFFTSARPVVVDASDVQVVRNVLDNLPLVWSFEPGETQLLSGVQAAADLARDWPANSTTMFLCTDGDTVDFEKTPDLPRSIRAVEVLAVGDPLVGARSSGRDSRQQAAVLRRLAVELGGRYHDVNRVGLRSEVLTDLAQLPPLGEQPWDPRDVARLAIVLGATLLVAIPIALQLAGSAWRPDAELPMRAPAAASAASATGPSLPLPGESP